MTRHYLPHLVAASALQKVGAVPFGTLPEPKPVIYATRIVDAAAAAAARETAQAWTQEGSVFEERAKTADAEALLTPARFLRKMLRQDIKRLHERVSFPRLLRRIAGDDRRADPAVAEEAAFGGCWKAYATLLSALDHYAARDATEDPCGGLSRAAFLELCDDAGIIGKGSFSADAASRAFAQATAGGGDKAAGRRELVELFLRMADAVCGLKQKFAGRGRVAAADVRGELVKFHDEHLGTLPEAARCGADRYRAERLYPRPRRILRRPV